MEKDKNISRLKHTDSGLSTISSMLKIPISTQSQIQTKWYRTKEQSTITEHKTKQNKWYTKASKNYKKYGQVKYNR